MCLLGSDPRTSEVNAIYCSCKCHSWFENEAVNIVLIIAKNTESVLNAPPMLCLTRFAKLDLNAAFLPKSSLVIDVILYTHSFSFCLRTLLPPKHKKTFQDKLVSFEE